MMRSVLAATVTTWPCICRGRGGPAGSPRALIVPADGADYWNGDALLIMMSGTVCAAAVEEVA
jgi:hypothetical protein